MISTGGKLVRSDIAARLVEQGGECLLDGLYIADESQQMDFHTFIEHVAPACCRRQDYRGVLDDRSRAVLNGRVHVHKDAQQNHNSKYTQTMSNAVTVQP